MGAEGRGGERHRINLRRWRSVTEAVSVRGKGQQPEAAAGSLHLEAEEDVLRHQAPARPSRAQGSRAMWAGGKAPGGSKQAGGRAGPWAGREVWGAEPVTQKTALRLLLQPGPGSEALARGTGRPVASRWQQERTRGLPDGHALRLCPRALLPEGSPTILPHTNISHPQHCFSP